MKEKVAVKILNKKQIAVKNEMHLVQRELNIIPHFNHINVIKVSLILQDEDNYYIIMEYCERGELFDYIVKKKKLSEEEASNFFYQLISGVEYIHQNNIVHRDLKPENLLITSDNTLKIIDFGLSSTFDGKNLLLTKCGSPSYAAPEIIRGLPYDGYKTDIWCCGIILFAMICGYLPFEGENNKALFKNILLCQLDFPEHVSIHARKLITELLNPEPSERIDIPQIKTYKFYLQGKNNCPVLYEKKKIKHLHFTNSDNLMELNAFRKKILQLNNNPKGESLKTRLTKIIKKDVLNVSNTTNKVLRTQGNIQLRSKHNSNFDFTHAISPSATPTTTASNIELNKKIGIKNTYKFSLKLLIAPRNTNKHHIPHINGEKYTYNPNQLTNRFNSPQGRLQISTRGITNRDKHYYVLPFEPK